MFFFVSDEIRLAKDGTFVGESTPESWSSIVNELAKRVSIVTEF